MSDKPLSLVCILYHSSWLLSIGFWKNFHDFLCANQGVSYERNNNNNRNQKQNFQGWVETKDYWLTKQRLERQSMVQREWNQHKFPFTFICAGSANPFLRENQLVSIGKPSSVSSTRIRIELLLWEGDGFFAALQTSWQRLFPLAEKWVVGETSDRTGDPLAVWRAGNGTSCSFLERMHIGRNENDWADRSSHVKWRTP